MSSIPLPALDIKTQPAPDLLDKFAQVQQLKASMQQQAMQQQEAPVRQQILSQQAQTGQLQIQQQQAALQNQQAVTQAYQQWDGKSYEDLAHLALKGGATGEAVQSIQQHGLAVRKTASDIAEQDAKTGSDNATTLSKQTDQAAGALNGVLSAPPEQMPQLLVSTVQQLAQQKRPDGTPLLDAQHVQMAQQLAQQGPQAISAAIPNFAKSLTAFSAQLEAAQKQAATAKDTAEAGKIKASTDPTSPLYAPSAAAVALGTAPGSQQIQQGEVRQAAAKAGAEENARMPGEMALARQRQALSQGDPAAAGKLLVSGDATLSELKARGATPQFIEAALNSAHQLSNGTYNAPAADAQAKVANSEDNVKFFGSAKSLTDPGGTLDQLAKAGKLLPQSQLKALNTIADWTKAATSNGPLAHYAATALGVADDYAKVMGGGVGSDSSRQQALDLAKANAGPNARAGAIEGIRGSVDSQVKSRIGNNPVLGRMYGTPATSGSSASAQAAPATHSFSLSAWQKANPQGDPNAAKAAATAAGYTVTQ